jgi:creatine kinase
LVTKEKGRRNSLYQFSTNVTTLESAEDSRTSDDNSAQTKSTLISKLQTHPTTTSLGPWMDNIASLGCIPVVTALGASSPIEEKLLSRRDTFQIQESNSKGGTPSNAEHQKRGTSISDTSSSFVTSNVDSVIENPNPTIQELDYANEYPNFTRHRSDFSLKQYLTPKLYNELKNLSNNTNAEESIDDIIKCGVTLPYGGMVPMPHGSVSGVYIGYPSSFDIYSSILLPMIESYHFDDKDNGSVIKFQPKHSRRRSLLFSPFTTNSTNPHHNTHHSINTNISENLNKLGRAASLQRHETNLNPKELVQRKLDDDGRYILYTRMRVARSITGFPFPTKMNRAARRKVEQLLISCVNDWNDCKIKKTDGQYKSIMDLSNYEHEELIRRHVLYPNPDDFLNLAGFGNDWPDGRGLYCDTWTTDDLPNIMIWCNAYDHYWIISHEKGGNVQEVFTRLSEAVSRLEHSLQQRNHHFVEHPKLGYLNSSLADVGTALRASVFIKLVRLGQLPGFHDILCKKLHLQARQQLSASDKEDMHRGRAVKQPLPAPRYTGVFHIANAASLGKNEVELVNIMIEGVAKCIELEKRLENGESIDLSTLEL